MLQVKARQYVYGAVTDCIIDLLEQGIVPWHTSFADTGIPSNLLTNRPYRAINVLMLAAHGYEQNYFLTERQIEKLGGYIYKGEKPHLVVDGIGFRSLRPYEVFNIHQVGNIAISQIPKLPERRPSISICKEVIEGMSCCPRLTHHNARPSYSHKNDCINMPPMGEYDNRDYYFSDFMTLLVWCTMHENRLDRAELVKRATFDTEATDLVELIVQIASWYLRNHCGLHIRFQDDNTDMSYWIDKFKANERLAFEAAEMAQEAAEFIIGEPFDEKEAIDYVEDEMLPF